MEQVTITVDEKIYTEADIKYLVARNTNLESINRQQNLELLEIEESFQDWIMNETRPSIEDLTELAKSVGFDIKRTVEVCVKVEFTGTVEIGINDDVEKIVNGFGFYCGDGEFDVNDVDVVEVDEI